jgi:hypothetical protein
MNMNDSIWINYYMKRDKKEGKVKGEDEEGRGQVKPSLNIL